MIQTNLIGKYMTAEELREVFPASYVLLGDADDSANGILLCISKDESEIYDCIEELKAKYKCNNYRVIYTTPTDISFFWLEREDKLGVDTL